MYPLQQTSCTALYVAPARIDERASEERLLAPGTVRAEAYAVFLALAHEWAAGADWPIDSLEVEDGDGHPIPGAMVVLGGALTLETDPSGRVRFARSEPGPLAVEIQHPRIRRRMVLLESERGVVVAGSRGLEQ